MLIPDRLRPGRARLSTRRASTGSPLYAKQHRQRRLAALDIEDDGSLADDQVGLRAQQLGHQGIDALARAVAPMLLDR
jgi:hypothetical protein